MHLTNISETFDDCLKMVHSVLMTRKVNVILEGTGALLVIKRIPPTLYLNPMRSEVDIIVEPCRTV